MLSNNIYSSELNKTWMCGSKFQFIHIIVSLQMETNKENRALNLLSRPLTYSNMQSFLYWFLEDMERAIIRDLVSHILVFSLHLLKAVDFAAELDW